MKTIDSYNICFLGRTGNGKSSLINALWGTKFSTDPLVSCTKEMYTVTVLEENLNGNEGVTVIDTPGIGEFSTDSKYERFYEHAVSVADCVVLVSTFDRTDAPAQRLLKPMKECLDPSKNTKFIVALNHIDSSIIAGVGENYEPWDEEHDQPSDKCLQNIEERISILHQKLDGKFLPFEVIPVCAVRGYGINALKTSILNYK